ncbi:MAG TPA: hypothetical protein PL009_03585 [Flavipsychrobacter sp.]|nr:hypothetical protein [Flavipsychrobacter sp.]
MPIQFNDPRTTKILNTHIASVTPANLSVKDERNFIPDSGDVAGIELRMLPPYIRNNRTPRFLFFPGNARLYCLTMVISDVANQLAGIMDLNGFHAVGDNEFLPINKTIFYWENDSIDADAPNQVHIVSSIIKCKERLRNTGSILTTVKEDNEYKDLIDTLSSVVSDTVNFNLVANISLQLAKIVGRYMGKVDDQPIGTAINSFTRLHGDWDKLGITPVNVATKNVDFRYELIVRDKERLAFEKTITSGRTEIQKVASTTMVSM